MTRGIINVPLRGYLKLRLDYFCDIESTPPLSGIFDGGEKID